MVIQTMGLHTSSGKDSTNPPLPTRHVVDNNSQRQLGSPPVNEHQRNQDHISPGQLGIIKCSI